MKVPIPEQENEMKNSSYNDVCDYSQRFQTRMKIETRGIGLNGERREMLGCLFDSFDEISRIFHSDNSPR